MCDVLVANVSDSHSQDKDRKVICTLMGVDDMLQSLVWRSVTTTTQRAEA